MLDVGHRVWKPRLHEIASGLLGDSENAIPYLALARANGFWPKVSEGSKDRLRIGIVGRVRQGWSSPPSFIERRLQCITLGG
jgi:hypothetical protein